MKIGSRVSLSAAECRVSLGEVVFITKPIADADVSLGFTCGVGPLDEYFARHALPNDSRGIGRTYVLSLDDEPRRIIGYYTLGMGGVDPARLPKKIGRGLPKFEMPVAMIGRLAVANTEQKKGWGEKLLIDALSRIEGVAEQIGCFGIVVDAKDERAETFYSRYDFATLD